MIGDDDDDDKDEDVDDGDGRYSESRECSDRIMFVNRCLIMMAFVYLFLFVRLFVPFIWGGKMRYYAYICRLLFFRPLLRIFRFSNVR